MAALISNGVCPLNGRTPVAISNSITPSAQMSLDACAASPRSCSGDMYGSVPTAVPACVSAACICVTAAVMSESNVRLASPKSSTFTRRSGVTMTLLLFRSR